MLILDAAECPACGWRRPPEAGAAGQPLWRAELGRALPKALASAAVVGGRLCLCAEDGTVVALELASGALAWQQAGPAGRQRTLASGRLCLFASSFDLSPIPAPGAALVALDPAGGDELWRYPTLAHSLSAPAADDGVVYLTSSDGQLHAVDAATGTRRWQLAHGAWAAEAPAANGRVVVAGGRDSTLRAYTAQGAPLWSYEAEAAFAGPIRLSGGVVYACCWDGGVYALDARSGALRWRLAPERGQGTTSPPAIAGGRVFVGSRVYGNPTARAHPGYALLALDAKTGKELWRHATPKHIGAAPAVAGDLVLVGADDGTLRALDAASGEQRWQLALGARPVAAPQIDDGALYVGARDGTVAAVQWRARPAGAPGDPQALQQSGEHEQAAEAHALRGELEQAAAIYAGKLSQPRRAAQLYEQAGRPGLAGPLWEQVGELRRARDCYGRAGDQPRLAEALERLDEPLLAAQLYETIGQPGHAARLYERSGDRSRAAELYLRAGQPEQAWQIWQSLGAWERLADALIDDGQLGAAADLLAEHQQTERAAQLYERAGQLALALSMRVSLAHWERVAELARQVGDHEQAAAAHEQLGQPAPAAEAYERAAEQLAAANPASAPRAAELFERAAQLYTVALDERATACRRQVRRYRRQPEIVITGGAQQVFVEHHWNTLLVHVENVGHGPAFTIDIALQGPFDVEGNETIPGLRAGEARQLEVYVRPQRGEYGPKVPLEIGLTYADAQQQRYQGARRLPIHVVQQGAASPTATPLEIRVEDDQLRQIDPLAPEEPLTADQDAIDQQAERLRLHRRTLAQLLNQEAQLGLVHVPAGLSISIGEARAEIARIKAVLRGWGVPVDNAPDDADPTPDA